jgi:hypothetical protein
VGIQVRVSLPDRPGALATVTDAVARCGADLLGVDVLESEGGRAVDELRLRWPDGRDPAPLVDALTGCAGIQVLGARSGHWLVDSRPDLDLLHYVLSVPQRGLETLVDMAPAALDVDWAELRAPARRLELLYGTAGRAHDDVAPESMPVRARAGIRDDGAWAMVPITPMHSVLVLGRDPGPPFLRAELAHAERVVELAITALRACLDGGSGVRPSELTACLVGQPA